MGAKDFFKGMITPKPKRTPSKFNDLQPQIYKSYNELYAEEYSKYSSDYVVARVQGLGDNFFNYTELKVRLSDVRKSLQPSGIKNDDAKIIMIPYAKYNYLPNGAKVETMKNTWLVTNPTNMTGTYTEAVIVRCNASFNYYDYYGNIKTEPFYIYNEELQDNAGAKILDQKIVMGYMNCICQKNEITMKAIAENQRIILGNRAFYVTGYVDFIQEFSGDRNSCDMITFTIRAEETKEFDDIENAIAGGKNYSYEIVINGDNTITQSTIQEYSVAFLKNGEIVESTEEHPISFELVSSDTDIIEIIDGTSIYAKGIGTATITAKLTQNQALTDTIEVIVKESANEPEILSLGLIPIEIEQYNKATLKFAYFENGIETNESLNYSFSGAGKKNYAVSISEDTKTIEIECLSATRNALNIHISCLGITKNISINLVGY